jgi:hypothetical protein
LFVSLIYVLSYFICVLVISPSRDNAVVETGYGLEGRVVGVRVPIRVRFLPLHITASYPMDTGGPFPGGTSGLGLKLNTHLQIVPSSRILGFTHPLPHTSLCLSA